MDDETRNLRNVSRTSRVVFWIILTVLVGFLLYGFFSSSIGQYALLICCGGGLLVAVIGILSERGMRRS